MVFTINIHACVAICPENGKPYYIGKIDGKYQKIYGFPDIEVPKNYRRFLNESNAIYRTYTQHSESCQYFEDIINILDKFPTWNDLDKKFDNIENDYNWSQADHDLLKQALEWFDDQDVRFVMVWT